MTPENAEDVVWDVGIRLVGWRFPAEGGRRGTVVFLHGLGANRAGAIPIAAHFTTRGFDVVAYDGRAHGDSGGDACTYGFYEKRDLARVIDQLASGPVVAFGWSLGAGVALQAAAQDQRIALVVAVAPFSDLRTAAIERAPPFASRASIAEAFRIAEAQGRFRVEDASPMDAAVHIRAPVLVIHGAEDHQTPIAHAHRVFDRLAGPKKLVVVPGAGHVDVLGPSTWQEVDDFVSANLATRAPPK